MTRSSAAGPSSSPGRSSVAPVSPPALDAGDLAALRNDIALLRGAVEANTAQTIATRNGFTRLRDTLDANTAQLTATRADLTKLRTEFDHFAAHVRADAEATRAQFDTQVSRSYPVPIAPAPLRPLIPASVATSLAWRRLLVSFASVSIACRRMSRRLLPVSVRRSPPLRRRSDFVWWSDWVRSGIGPPSVRLLHDSIGPQ